MSQVRLPLESIPPEQRREAFDALAAQVRVCTLCPLHQTRTLAVPGEGPVDAVIAFVGEAPGADEDAQGRPFVGRSGQLLRRTIVEAGWREADVFIGNVLKCRPPGNRDPLDSEIACCRHYLESQLGLINPQLIVTLGRFSLGLLIDPTLKITQVRGKLIRKHGRLFVPTLHPAAILRNQSMLPEFRRDIFLSLKKAAQLAGLHETQHHDTEALP